MAYQYPPPQENYELGASQGGYVNNHLIPTVPTQEGTNEGDHGPLGLPNERRRNRLGYHRIAIACAHCRKRKIRCKQPEAPDVLRRCESCINLGRDCNYEAVNQPLPPTGQRQVVRPSSGVNMVPSPTSPAMPMGHPVETQPTVHYHPLATLPSTSSIGQQSMEPEDEEVYSTGPNISSNAPSDRPFNYGHDTSGWLSTEAGASTASTTGSTDALWTNIPHSIPESSDTSSYTSHQSPGPSSTWPMGSSGVDRINSPTRLDDVWDPYPVGTRSVSYNHNEIGRYASSSTRPTPIATNAIPEVSLGAQGPPLASAVPHQTYGAWQQYQYARPGEAYGGWYEENEHSPEAHVLSAGEDHSQAGGMYYGGR